MQLHKVNYLHSIFNGPWSLIHVNEWISVTETVLVEWYWFWDVTFLHKVIQEEERDVTIWSQLSHLFTHRRAIERERIGQCIVFAGSRITGVANSSELIKEAVRWKTVFHSVYNRAAQTQNWKWNQEVGWGPEPPFEFLMQAPPPLKKRTLLSHPHSKKKINKYISK